MRLLIAYDLGCLRRWHVWLARALAKDHEIVLAGVVASRPIPSALGVLLSFERTVYLRGGESASDWCDAGDFSGSATVDDLDLGEFALAVDLSSGQFQAPESLRVVAPLYNGIADELAAVEALMRRGLVNLGIYDSALASSVHLGRSAADDPNILSKSLDNVFCRTAALLLRAVEQPPARAIGVPPPARCTWRLRRGAELSFLVTSVACKAIALLNKLCSRGAQWSIAWRHTDGDALCEKRPDKGCTFARHPNNQGSYFADPFVLARDGRHYLFVEEFLFAAGKGVISVISIEADGTVSPSRVVLERPYHLSYPFVFEHDGEVFMIPESGAVGRVELYRAHVFPDQWSLEAVLIDGVTAYDATLCEHAGRLWMLMATTRWQSSSWDTLEIFHAPELQGPWAPLESNPVLVDPASARPGGRMYERAGKLWRPAQSSSTIYGGSLALCRIDQLAPDGFHQTAVSLLEPDPQSTVRGVHTLNHAKGLEAIDLFGMQSGEPARLSMRRMNSAADGS